LFQTPAAPVLARANKKRKDPEDYTSATSNVEVGTSIKRGRNDKKPDKDKAPAASKSKNTAVYVTGLPLDTEADELVERFAKCGVVEEDDNGEPKVKLYAREDGSFSGEALVVYFKEDSVLLALNLLDDAEFRLGDSSTTMRVQKAEFSHKNSAEHGETKPRKTMDKKKATKRIGKMQKCVSVPVINGLCERAKTAEGNCRNGTMKTDSDQQ
jgi:HIV Tat-specific factor 1